MRQPRFFEKRVIHGKTSIGLYSPFSEDSRSLRGTEERTGNSKGIAEPMKITFLMEPNLILNISLPSLLLFLFLLLFFFLLFFFETNQISLFPPPLFSSSSLMQNPSDEAAIRSTELPRCIFITKEKTERIISNVSWR